MIVISVTFGLGFGSAFELAFASGVGVQGPPKHVRAMQLSGRLHLRLGSHPVHCRWWPLFLKVSCVKCAILPIFGTWCSGMREGASDLALGLHGRVLSGSPAPCCSALGTSATAKPAEAMAPRKTARAESTLLQRLAERRAALAAKAQPGGKPAAVAQAHGEQAAVVQVPVPAAAIVQAPAPPRGPKHTRQGHDSGSGGLDLPDLGRVHEH